MEQCRYATFGAAGVHGMCYVGAVQKYIDASLFSAWRDNLIGIGGVSSGSIMALMLSIRMSIEEIKEFLRRFPFTEILLKDMTGSVPSFIRGEGKGFLSGLSLTFVVRTILIEKNLDPDLTFKGLCDLGFPELRVLALDLTHQAPVLFSSTRSPDTPLHVAIRASMSIPFIFHAVKWNKSVLIDGAFVDSTGSTLFEDIPEANSTTIAFSVCRQRNAEPSTRILDVFSEFSRFLLNHRKPSAAFHIEIDPEGAGPSLNLLQIDVEHLIEHGSKRSVNRSSKQPE